MDFQGKTAVVTGGASGIGRAVSLAFARLGSDIIVADINDDRMREIQKEIEGLGRRAVTVHCDVRSDADVQALAARAFDEMEHVDILMNNAGVVLAGPVEKVTMQDWDWILQTNLLGIVRGLRAFLPHMIERGSGYIVNTASLAGLFAHSPTAIPYIAVKHAVVGLSEGLALYLKPKGIGVSVLCPGIVRTNLAETARYVGMQRPTVAQARAQGRAPVIREPDEVAEKVVEAVQDGRFHIFTEGQHREMLVRRLEDIDAALDSQIAQLTERGSS